MVHLFIAGPHSGTVVGGNAPLMLDAKRR